MISAADPPTRALAAAAAAAPAPPFRLVNGLFLISVESASTLSGARACTPLEAVYVKLSMQV